MNTTSAPSADIPQLRRASYSRSSIRSTSSRASSTASLPPSTWRQSFIGLSASPPTSPHKGHISSPLAHPILSASTTEADHRQHPTSSPSSTQKPKAKDRLRSLIPNFDSSSRKKRQRVASQVSFSSVKDSQGVFTTYTENVIMHSSDDQPAASPTAPSTSACGATSQPTPSEVHQESSSQDPMSAPASMDGEPSSSSSQTVPFPTSSSPPSSKPLPARTGWFSSLSRSSNLGRPSNSGKGKERISVTDVDFSPPSSLTAVAKTAEPQRATITETVVETSASVEDSQVTLKPDTEPPPGLLSRPEVDSPTPPPPSVSSPSSSTPTPTTITNHPTPISSPTPARKKTGWFSYGSPTVPPAPIQQPSPKLEPTSPPKRGSFSSSIDDSVPSSPSTSSPPPPQSGRLQIYSSIRPDLKIDSSDSEVSEGEGNKSQDTVKKKKSHDSGEKRERKLSSLNPSTSRFSLGVVLLGRGSSSESGSSEGRKKDEQKDLVQVPNDDTSTIPSTNAPPQPASLSTDSTEPPSSKPETTSSANTAQAPNPQDTGSSTPTSDPSPPNQKPTDPSDGSGWWAYLRWSSDNAAASGSSANDDNKKGEDSASTTNEVDQAAPSNGNAAPILAEGSQATDIEGKEGSGTQESPGDEVENQKKEEGSVGTTGAWYSPWAWYGGSGSTSAPSIQQATAAQPEDQKEGGEIDVAGTGKPEGEGKELIKPPPSEQTAKADDPIDPPPRPASAPLPDPINPTSPSSLSTWTSFWSSKVVGNNIKAKIESGKLIKEHGEDMEVMDVPDDVDGTEEGSSGGGKKDKGKQRQTQPTPRDDDKMRLVRQAPPLIVSEDIKKEVSLTSSPNASPRERKRKSSAQSNSLPVSRQPSGTTSNGKGSRDASPTPSKKSVSSVSSSTGGTSKVPKSPPPPNLVLPSFKEIFHAPPRSIVPISSSKEGGLVEKLGGFVRGVLFNTPESPNTTTSSSSHLSYHPHWPHLTAGGVEDQKRWGNFGMELARAWEVIDGTGGPETGKVNGPVGKKGKDVLRGARKAVVLGVHGWFPGGMMRSVIGEPTGTSTKFATMMVNALEEFEEKHGVKFDKITPIPLEGEGTIEGRVDKLYTALTSNEEWMSNLHEADVIFVATHSQGSIVSTHLLDRLYRDGHIVTQKGSKAPESADARATFTSPEETDLLLSSPPRDRARKPQKVCCLALCGIHLGPLRYLGSSSAFQGYIQYFESVAARQLFEFQNTENKASQEYIKALENVLDHETKMVYIASLNDQVVPIYSGIFTTAQHPLILRALYIDGDAYNNYDYISNLLVLLIKVLNSGISDSGLLAHLSEATAGSLNGVGHSTAYEEIANFQLAVDYMFLTDEGMSEQQTKLTVEPFNAALEQNDYEIPWALRDLIADERVTHFFADEIIDLREKFRDWYPKTSILRDMKRKLSPIQRLPPGIQRHSVVTSPTQPKL